MKQDTSSQSLAFPRLAQDDNYCRNYTLEWK